MVAARDCWCQNRGQAIDSSEDSLFDPNIGSEYHISDAIYTYPRSEWGLIKSDPPLAAIRVWSAPRIPAVESGRPAGRFERVQTDPP